MVESISLPEAFDADPESEKILKRVKAKASKGFKFTKANCLESATNLAFYLYIFRRAEEALGVCEFLGQYPFDGNFNLWTWIELSLSLQSRIYIESSLKDKSDACVRRLAEAGYVKARLQGELLEDNVKDIEQAVADGSKTDERDYRVLVLQELCFMKALGGSGKYPAGKLEEMIQDNLKHLRRILKVD